MLIVKIMCGPEDSSAEHTLPHTIVSGVTRVDFRREETGCWADVYTSGMEIYPVEVAAFVMNEAGKTVSSFYV